MGIATSIAHTRPAEENNNDTILTATQEKHKRIKKKSANLFKSYNGVQ